MRWRLKSPASRLFTQPFIQAQIKENIKAPRHWPLWGESTVDRWITRTKGEWRGKCFHLMTSSWYMVAASGGHDMENHSILLAFCKGNPRGGDRWIPLRREKLRCFSCYLEQPVEQTAELPVTWDDMTLIQRSSCHKWAVGHLLFTCARGSLGCRTQIRNSCTPKTWTLMSTLSPPVAPGIVITKIP